MRFIILTLVVCVVVWILFSATSTLSILKPSRYDTGNPSAVQITQVHSEAQTTLLTGIAILLALNIAANLFIRKDTETSG